MLQAIISDIHANIEALEVVLEDIRKRDIRDIICLGDMVGYGPNPCECVDIAREFRLSLMGNHEEAALNIMHARGFNPKASSAVRWTVAQFDILQDREKNGPRWDFMGELKPNYKANGVFCVHGSPLDYTRGYIYGTDTRNPNKMSRIFAEIEHVCFVGHTHIPGIWTEDLTFQSPEELDYVYQLDNRKTIINVGSVGQPRDMDNRACYVLFDGSRITFRKLKYPFEKTARKIFSIPELDASLGHRLREGK